MDLQQILSYFAALGLGGILGVIIKSIADYKINQRRLLFEARSKAYARITGRIFNLFLEPDITLLRSNALRFAKINLLFAEASLLGTHKLTNLLSTFQDKVYEYHKMLLEKTNEAQQRKLHSELVDMAPKIFAQMRKDLFIGINPLWIKRK